MLKMEMFEAHYNSRSTKNVGIKNETFRVYLHDTCLTKTDNAATHAVIISVMRSSIEKLTFRYFYHTDMKTCPKLITSV